MGLAVEQWAALPSDDPRRPLFARALRVLAAREHGREELRKKLLIPPVPRRQRYGIDKKSGNNRAVQAKAAPPDADMLEDVLDALEREGYLSDERFAESFVNQRARRGHGPLRIKHDLQQKAVSSELIADAFAAAETDWFELAVDVRCRKFGENLPTDFKEKARQMRFLQSRGFEMQHIQHALQPE